MSTVDVPWGRSDDRETGPKKIRVQTGLEGRLELLASDGLFEVWLDKKRVLGPVDETAARNRFRTILQPKVEERRTETKEEVMILESAMHLCPGCGCEVSDERKTMLGVVTCPKCTPQPGPVYGVLDYSHKTGGVLMITDDRELFKLLKKPINQQR